MSILSTEIAQDTPTPLGTCVSEGQSHIVGIENLLGRWYCYLGMQVRLQTTPTGGRLVPALQIRYNMCCFCRLAPKFYFIMPTYISNTGRGGGRAGKGSRRGGRGDNESGGESHVGAVMDGSKLATDDTARACRQRCWMCS